MFRSAPDLVAPFLSGGPSAVERPAQSTEQQATQTPSCTVPDVIRAPEGLPVTIRRGGVIEITDPAFLPCSSVDNFGCVIWEVKLPDPIACQAPSYGYDLSLTFVSVVFIMDPAWTGWKTGTPSCTAKGHNYGGGLAHECGHRLGLEAKLLEQVRLLKAAVDRANADTACARNCPCRGRQVGPAVASFKQALDDYARNQSETDALTAERNYYVATGCIP